MSFWVKFLKGVGRIGQLYLPGDDYTLHKAAKIYSRQCSSTVRTLLEAADGDMTEIIKVAESARLNKKQRDLLADLERQKTVDEKASENAAAILEAIGEKKQLSRNDRLIMWQAGEDVRKLNERRENWQALGIGNVEFMKEHYMTEEERSLCDQDLSFE